MQVELGARAKQAAGLMKFSGSAVKVIAVTGGKGGVGKTSVAVNMAMSMAMAGRKTMLFDADLGLANVDVLLGLQPTYNLAHLLAGECEFDDVLIRARHGLMVVPATSGTRHMSELGVAEHAALIHAFSNYHDLLDTLVVDTAAGIAANVLAFTQAAQQIVVVVCDEPASITDAYALMKVLSRSCGVTRFHVVANRVESSMQGHELFGRLARVSERFLDVTLDYMGAIPEDGCLRKAIGRQRAVVDAYPGSSSAGAFQALAKSADKWSVPQRPNGNLEFFMERLIEPRPLWAGVAL